MRKTGFILFIIISIPILLFAYVLWANRPVQYVKPVYNPPKDNAWNYYERALMMPWTSPNPEPRTGETSSNEYRMPNPPDNLIKMTTVRQGFGKPCVLPPSEDIMYNGLRIGKVEYTRAREMCRIFAREGNSLVDRKHYAKAADAYLDGVYFATDLGQGGFMPYLTSNAMTAICITPFDKDVVDELAASECDIVLKRLAQVEKRKIDLSKILLDQKNIQKSGWSYFTINNQGDILNRLKPDAYSSLELNGKEIGALGSIRFIMINKRREASKLDYYFDRMSDESAKPYCERSNPYFPNSFVMESSYTRDVAEHQGLVVTFYYTREQTHNRILTLRLALRACYLRNGCYPEKLSRDLSKHLRKEDLIDPFDGKPLRYRRNGSGYVLYSVGPDGKDDKGKPMPTGKHPEEKGDIACMINKS